MLLKSRVKYIQSLGQKKFRDQEGVFVAEGPKLINELLHAENVDLVWLFAIKEWIDHNQRLAGKLSDSKVYQIDEAELKRVSYMSTPNQVLGIFRRPVFIPIGLSHEVSLVLDGIQDPGNLGTIVRTADWFGIKRVICSFDCADVYNPKTIQATMGSICRVLVTYADLKMTLIDLAGLPVFGAVLDGKNLMELDKIKEGLILIGNESKGIRNELIEQIQYQITIPRQGKAESLNAAVATGIILSHLL
jgi:RNA methyltransferase, TrmH family